MKREIIVRSKAARAIRQGTPLIGQMDLAMPLEVNEGECVRVVDERGQFLGMAYVGLQNKGVGWIYSDVDGQLLDKSFVSELFLRAREAREGLLQSEETTAFRIFNGEGDGLGGVTVDWYHTFVVVSWYSEGIYLWKDVILDALQHIWPEVVGIYEKVRFPNEAELPETSHVRGIAAMAPHYVKEEGVRYATYLNEGLMTGIFLDQREVRTLLRESYSAGRRVLNLFSYTGAFSVAAALGGASETVSVDVANRSLEKTREQFTTNGIDPDTQRIYVMDVFDYLKYATKKDLTFDTIVLDPPSFARTKKRTFSVAKDYAALVAQLVPLTAKNGTLILSTNAANVTAPQFLEMIEKGLRSSGRLYRITHQLGLPHDFPVPPHTPLSDYLKVVIVELA